MTDIILQKTQFPDSLELDFGGARKGGKVYFNASDVTEAKERISNMKILAVHTFNELQKYREETQVKISE